MCSPPHPGGQGHTITLVPTPIPRDTARGSLRASNPGSLSLCRYEYTAQSLSIPLEGAWKAQTFILRTPPSSWPNSQPNHYSLTDNFPPPNLLIKLWRKFSIVIQIMIKTELSFTAMHLLDFQREFYIGGCVLINRNMVIVISRPN